MNSKHLDIILKDYEKNRLKAEYEAQDKKDEIYKKIPRIKQIDEELSSLGIQITKAIIKKDKDISILIDSLKQKSNNLKIEKKLLLDKYNYPSDYFEVKYACPNCKDTGYMDFKKCSCFKQKLIDILYNQSNLKHILDKENFDTFVFDYYSVHKFENEPISPRKNMEHIFNGCINFVKNFDTASENLFFYGSSGIGKTFLSNCIAKDLLDAGRLVIYQTASGLIELIKANNFESEDKSETIKDIYECELLIIDDLGTEYITNYSQMELFNIINQRLLSNKKIIISTNLSLDDIFKIYSERITSRIFGRFTICKFYGEDIRIRIMKQKMKQKKI